MRTFALGCCIVVASAGVSGCSSSGPSDTTDSHADAATSDAPGATKEAGRGS
jgi:hypothetical protein